MRQKLQGLGNQDSLFCASPPGLGATPLHLHLHGAGRGGGFIALPPRQDAASTPM